MIKIDQPMDLFGVTSSYSSSLMFVFLSKVGEDCWSQLRFLDCVVNRWFQKHAKHPETIRNWDGILTI